MIVRHADTAPSPWANGGGVTRQLLVHPPQAALAGFLWRMSVAEITTPAEFSCLPQVDRVLVLLQGEGLTLRLAHTAHVLQPCLSVVAFRGESVVHAQPAQAGSHVLNVMTRRGAVVPQIHIQHGSYSPLAVSGSRVCYVAAGHYLYRQADGSEHTLAAGDALQLPQVAAHSLHALDEASVLVETVFTY